MSEKSAERQENSRRLIPALHKAMPNIMALGAAYHKAYPVDTTEPAVVDAVTVSVPLRHFMLMAAFTSNAVASYLEETGQSGDTQPPAGTPE